MEEIIIRPDSKRRINLGELSQGVSSYRVIKGDNGSLTLMPYMEIPITEKWIFENKDILEKMRQEVLAKQDIVSF